MRTICQTATILMTFSTLSVCILWGALPEGVVIFSRGNAIFPSSLQAQKCCTLFECVVTTVNNYHSATFSAPLHTPAASASPVHDWIRSAVRSGNGCVPQSLPQSLRATLPLSSPLFHAVTWISHSLLIHPGGARGSCWRRGDAWLGDTGTRRCSNACVAFICAMHSVHTLGLYLGPVLTRKGE